MKKALIFVVIFTMCISFIPVSNGYTSAKSVGKLKKNQKVTILNKKGSWHYIQYGKTKGYVYSKYISDIK